MPNQDTDVVSFSAFAALMGCANSTIGDYYTAGKLSGAALHSQPGKKPKLIYGPAKSQYLEARANVEHRFSRSIQAKKDQPETTPPATSQFQPDESADMVTVYSRIAPAVSMPRSIAERMKLRTTPYGPEDEDRASLDSEPARKKLGPVERERRSRKAAEPDNMLGDLANELPDNADISSMSVQQLTKREAELRVRLKQLEIDEKTGEVVKKEDVYAALFTTGQEVRGRIEAIPDRVIDGILAAPNRTEALLLLTREIKASLQGLADLGNTQLTGNRKAGAKTAR